MCFFLNELEILYMKPRKCRVLCCVTQVFHSGLTKLSIANKLIKKTNLENHQSSQITLFLFIATRLNPFRMEPFELEKDVSFKSGKRRSGSKASLIILSVLSLILLVISIVFVTLYALEKAKKTSAPQIHVPGEQKYCGSKACFHTAKGRI